MQVWARGGRWAAPVLVALAALGCARQAGSRAAGGAMDTVREKVEQEAAPGEAPMQTIAGRAVDGAITHLTSPQNVAAVQRVVQAATSQAVKSALDAASQPVLGTGIGRVELLVEETTTALRTSLSEGLVSDLGRDGHGPLGASLSATARNAAASATDGALVRLLPTCTADDPDCLDRRLAELSYDAAAGFMRGVRDSIEVGALIAAFLAGLAVATIVALAVALLRRRHHTAEQVS
jgi:hypothetical protein